MDPTIELCLVKSSFEPRPVFQLDSQLIPQRAPSPSQSPPRPTKQKVSIRTFQKRHISTVGVPLEKVVDVEQFSQLQASKNEFDTIKESDKNRRQDGSSPYFETLRSYANPFEGVGGDVFWPDSYTRPDFNSNTKNRAGTKLANIDAIYNLTGTMSNHFAQNQDGVFTFCDIAGGPGSWSVYLQFRWPGSQGYGITLRKDEKEGQNLNWARNRLDMDRFSEYYGPDGSDLSGNLFTHAGDFGDYVKRNKSTGVDLVVCDGGLDDTGQEEFQETVNSRLIFSEIYSSLLCLKKGGHMVLKVYDLVTKFSVDFVRILYSCFDELHIFKPMSSRPANSERYIICRNRKDDISEYINICKQVYKSFTNELMVMQIFEDTDPEFETELKRLNDTLSVWQKYYVDIILNLHNKEQISVPVYNLHRATSIWRIPDPEELYRAQPVSRIIRIFSELDFILRPSDLERSYERRMLDQKTVVHWGQRKLVLTLVQFLTRFWDQRAHPRPQIVYVGVTSGESIAIVSRMFQACIFHLYNNDPNNSFQISPSDRIRLYEDVFTDHTAQFWSKEKSVFFVSDIRVVTQSEGLIQKELDIQRQWYETINPVAAHLKFRLPYAPQISPNSNTPPQKAFFEYLNGHLFKQPWTPASSTETRLVPFDKSAIGSFNTSNPKVAVSPTIMWDTRKYESQMFYHNTMIREKQKFKNPFTGKSNDPIWEKNLENDYDSTCEAIILKEYREKFGKLVTQAEVVQMSRKITEELNLDTSRYISLESIRKEPHRFKRLSE